LSEVAARLAPETLLAEVQSSWAQVAGEAVARAAQPTAERDGVVTVTCQAAVWAHELDLLGPALVDRMNAALGRPAVRSLRCHAGPERGSPRVGRRILR
jgi:predicted nucleic acid-binding Zn ribbon protein